MAMNWRKEIKYNLIAEEERVNSMRKTFNRIGFGMLAMMAAATLAQLALSFVALYFQLPGWFYWVIVLVSTYLVGIPLAVNIFPAVEEQTIKTQKMGAKNFWLFFLMCFPIMYAGSFVGTAISLLLSGGNAVNTVASAVMDDSWLKILVVVIIAPLFEEFLCRKQLIDRCAQYGEAFAVIFSALVFALMHQNLYQFFYALGFGWLFGYVYLRTRRLRYSTLLHMLVNFHGSVISPLILNTADFEAMAETGSYSPGIIVYLILMLGLSLAGSVILIVYSKRFHYNKYSSDLTLGTRIKNAYCNPGIILYVLVCTAVATYALQIF